MDTMMNNTNGGVIIRNMQMPEACLSCMFCHWYTTYRHYRCMLTHNQIIKAEHYIKRRPDCPLEPLKN